MELEIEKIEIVSADNIQVEVPNEIEISEGKKDYEVSVVKKEYTIIGDSIFIPSMYGDAPPWLKEFIDTTIDIAVTNRDQSLIDRMHSILTAIDYVPKNQYTEQINQIVSEDGIINSRIATLNSNFTNAINTTNATVAEINLTYASKDEAAAIANNVITASLSSSGKIGSALIQLQEAYATLENTTAQSINMLESVMEGEINGTATAINKINTYIGITNGAPNGTGALADIEILKKQNDGIIETITGTYDVMVNPQDPNLAELVLTAEPYVTWKAQDVSGIDTRLAHIGDVYVKYGITSNGAREYLASFKFIRTIVDANDAHKSTDADGFTWALIIDQAAQDAYKQALNAYDLADDKRRVFVGLGATSTPSVPYDQGDLWLIDAARTVNGYACKVGDILRCIESKGNVATYEQNDWVLASSYANAVAAEAAALETWKNTTYASTIATIQTQVDGKAETFYQSSIPTGRIKSINVPTNNTLDKYVGDLWKNTYVGTTGGYLGNNTEYIYTKTANGSNWNYDWTKMEVPDIVFDTIDTKKSIYSGDSVPVAVAPDVIEVNDMWIPSATNGTYLQGEIYQYNGTSWVVATKYSANLEAVKNNLQSQIDGKVDTYYQGTVPTGMTVLNNGDYWYCTSDLSIYKKGKVYKYVHATTSWVETADVSRYAFDTADGKAAIFTSTNAPTTGYKVNDMLIVIGSFNNGTTTFSDGVVLSSNANRVSGFTASDWVKKINDTEDLDAFVSTTYTPTVTSLQNQVDSKIESWYTVSTSDPKTAWTDAATRAKHDGDMWYQKDTKLSYYYSSSTNSWNLIDDAKAIQALADAATAQATADGKISSYYMSTLAAANVMSNAWTATEKTNNIGDLVVVWDDSTLDNNGTWRWNGTNWVTTRDKKLIALASDVTNLSTELTNGTNTWSSADSTLENSLRTEITGEGARVESKFAYNSTLMLNGTSYNSGFGIATSLTSGSGLSTGQSEFWIKADKFKLMSADGGKKSGYSPFTVDSVTGEINFNGKVRFTNVSDTQGSGTNLLYNSAPKIGNETKGWSIGHSTHGLSSLIAAGNDPWRPAGGASVYIVVPGSPGIGTVFDINNSRFPVIANTRYEASAYLSSHRCNSWVTLAWFDINGNYISESGGTSNSNASGGPLSGWSRSTMFATAPSNAATAQFYVRSGVTGMDPHCFVAYAYAGIASTNQTIPSNWSEGSSAGVSSGDVVTDINNGNTTTIDGGKITTSSVTSVQIKSDAALINKLNVTGGLVANNIVVPGINSNNPLFSASGSQVVISNLKVLGTVSMPGVTKIANSGTFSGTMPVSNSGNGSPAVAYAGYVYKPYVCNTWGIIIICSVSNNTGTGSQKDLSVNIRINGVSVGHQVSSSSFNNNTTTTGGLGTCTGENAYIEILVGGYNTSGTYYGSFSYISAVEN